MTFEQRYEVGESSRVTGQRELPVQRPRGEQIGRFERVLGDGVREVRGQIILGLLGYYKISFLLQMGRPRPRGLHVGYSLDS